MEIWEVTLINSENKPILDCIAACNATYAITKALMRNKQSFVVKIERRGWEEDYGGVE